MHNRALDGSLKNMSVPRSSVNIILRDWKNIVSLQVLSLLSVVDVSKEHQRPSEYQGVTRKAKLEGQSLILKNQECQGP